MEMKARLKNMAKTKKVTKAGIDVGLLDNKHSEKQCRCKDGSERPVCGSDHVTYKNKCSLQKASCVKENNITLISERPCEDSDLCGQGGCPFYGLCLRDPEIGFYECHCQGCTPEDEDPVCGNDDVTYANQCELESESCRNQRPIKRAYKGKCKKDLCEGVVCQQGSHCDSGRCVCPTECQEDYKPVCGSDGHTHHNTCLMQKRSCENGEIKRKVIEVVHGGPCVHPKTKCDFQEEGSIGRGGKCKCPKGSTGSNCQDCSPGYWAYTSFGCTACNCHALGTAKAACDQVTGECVCKPGYSGKNCQVCPDKTMADQTSCSSSTTKYLNPIRCGQTEMCDFGATCSQSSGSCVCEVDCLKYGKSQQPVCGSDGNTYRSECQLRQYSCRIQKEVIIVSRQPCNDAPLSIYGVDGSDVLADGGGGGGDGRVISSIALYGMLGDVCVDDRDCFVENSVCSGGSDNQRKCGCKKNFQAAADNAMCSEVAVNRCDPNPCQNGGSCEEHDGTFSCYCQPNFAGSHCQLDMTATSDTNLEASFAGNAHVKARATEDIVSRLEVELSFRTFSNDGLLVYGGSGGSGTDYFSIKLEDGHLVFEYELGGGPVVLKSAARVTLGEWIEIKAKRYHQDGLLEVGPHHARVTGSAKGSLRTLNIPNVIWIGGLDLENSRESVEGASISRNFVGCMKNVKIGRTPLILNGNEQPGQDDVLERKNVQRCVDNPCSRMPCANEGFCSADTGTVGAFQCQCRKEFTGRHCEKPRNECHPNPCLNRGKCHLKYQGFHCQCKDGFYGRVCEKGAQAGSGQEGTRFKKSMPLDDKQKVTFGLKVNLSRALTAATDGGERLQTSAEEESRSWMFKVPTLSLEEGDGAVQFSLSAENQLSVSCRQTNVTLLADLRVSDGNWHQVTVVRTSQNLSLVVDKSVRATAPLHQPFSFLDKPLILNSLGTADYYCLKNFHLVSWRQGRKRRTESSDICR